MPKSTGLRPGYPRCVHLYVCTCVCIHVCVRVCVQEDILHVPAKVEVLVTQLCQTLCDPLDCSPPGSFIHGILQTRNTGVGSHSLFQGIFLIQALNLGLLHCREILYSLGHQ